jgi:mono/diheme cytochrome c family protein
MRVLSRSRHLDLLERPLRRVSDLTARPAHVAALFTIVIAASVGCAARADKAAQRYLRDRAFRRSALVASLVNPGNEYSTLRLARYATGDAQDWDRLPVWNPRVAPVRRDDLERTGAAAREAGRRLVADPDDTRLPDDAALLALGEDAFFNYPVELAPLATVDAAAVARYGLWVDPRRGVSGLVHAEMADGQQRIETTCATCHTGEVGGRLLIGAPNGRVDIGLMAADAGAGATPTVIERYRAWGPGRVDVTTGDGSVPERMADLRPIRWASHLHYDATVRQQDVVTLAIRIETLIITSKKQALRPPRIIALALAVYLRSLSDSLPPLPSAQASGAKVFDENCAECHTGPDLGGGPIRLATVGTDPTLGQSADRGTGAYRVPSLRGLSGRTTLLHDGALAGISSLLDPHRLDATYAGGARAAGPVPGHRFGLALSEPERRALVAYLELL